MTLVADYITAVDRLIGRLTEVPVSYVGLGLDSSPNGPRRLHPLAVAMFGRLHPPHIRALV